MEIQFNGRGEMLGVFYLDRTQPDGRYGIVIDIQEVSPPQMPITCVVAGIEAGEIDHQSNSAVFRVLLITHCVRDLPAPEFTFRIPNGRMTAKTDNSWWRFVSGGRDTALEDRHRGKHQDKARSHPFSRTSERDAEDQWAVGISAGCGEAGSDPVASLRSRRAPVQRVVHRAYELVDGDRPTLCGANGRT
jgi:hypothetical protein